VGVDVFSLWANAADITDVRISIFDIDIRTRQILTMTNHKAAGGGYSGAGPEAGGFVGMGAGEYAGAAAGGYAGYYDAGQGQQGQYYAGDAKEPLLAKEPYKRALLPGAAKEFC